MVTTPSAAETAIWIVVPAFNEGPRLAETLLALKAFGDHVIVVDDGSSDDTAEVALAKAGWVLRHLINCGQGAALQTGIDFALSQGATVIVSFDADGQHCPEDVERLAEPVLAGRADVVLGSRFLGAAPGLPWGRWLVLKLGVLFTRIFSRLAVTDTHNGLRAFSRDAALKIRITQNRMAHASEIIDQMSDLGLRYCEVPVTIRYSAVTLGKGQSSWNALRMAGQLILGKLIR
jgi:glycosyltransferase involved in cell wall biosynthesis